MTELPSPISPIIRRGAWAVVGLLWVVALLNYLDRQMITAMSGPIEADLGIAHARFGLFSSAFLWIYGAVSPLAGFAADRFSRRGVIVGSLLVWSTVTWLTGHVHSFEQMLAARALMGLSEACYIPAALALIVDYHRGPTRSLATGLHLSGAYAGSILGGLGGWVADGWGWRIGFNLFGLLGVGYALILLGFLKNPPPDTLASLASPDGPVKPVRLGETFRALLGTRSFLILLAMNALVGAAFWTIKNWLPTFFNTELQVSLTRSGIYGTAFFNLAAFLGMLAAGLIADRWSRHNPRARALVPALGFCVAAPCFFTVGLVQAVPLLLAAIVMVGFGQGCLDSNLMPVLCTVADSRHRATGYGLLNFISTTTGGLMTYAGGALKDAHVPFTTTFQAAALLILLAGLLLFAVKPAPLQNAPVIQ